MLRGLALRDLVLKGLVLRGLALSAKLHVLAVGSLYCSVLFWA